MDEDAFNGPLSLLLCSGAEVMTANPIEIPQNRRDMSEQSLKQAHAEYENLTDFVTKAMGIWLAMIPANPLAAVFKDVQDRAIEIAMENSESVFTFGGKISNAQTFQELLTIQTQFAQDRMQAYAEHTQELYGLIGEAFQKLNRS